MGQMNNVTPRPLYPRVAMVVLISCLVICVCVCFCNTYIYCVLSVYLSLLFCSYFVVLCFFIFVLVLCIFIFVCTSVGLLPPGESPIAVSNNNNVNFYRYFEDS